MARRKKHVLVRCMDCAKGTFMQWFNNPIICECNIGESNKERYVAMVKKECELFKQREEEPIIKHFDHYE